MYSYDVFAGTLKAPFQFPELQQTSGPASWILERGDIPSPLDPASLIGDDDVYGEVKVRCYRTMQGHSLVYDDTGRFDVSDGALIRWFAPHDADDSLLEAVRADVVGRVLALALHQHDVLCLHASAVSINGRGIALLAPKMHGKSTLATALVRGGARLLSDDTVPVTPDATPLVRPGVHQLRLWKDSASRLAAERMGESAPARKVVLDHFDEGTVQRSAVPLAALYVLLPSAPDDAESARRSVLTEIQATLALVEHAKLGPLLGRKDAGLMFEQSAAIARRVPVYLLHVARDLDRLADAAATILGWHR
ncbi:MAG: hypothetical protein IT361_14345 [Gemmatimonadaceae bacterium]|nr:hypothetical protein [Gemmatimonadaceae bacterium]